MNKAELKTKLQGAGVRPQSYSLDGGLPNERYVLSQQSNDRWEVYYCERGGKSSFHSFDSESAACEFFLNQLLLDPTATQK